MSSSESIFAFRRKQVDEVGHYQSTRGIASDQDSAAAVTRTPERQQQQAEDVEVELVHDRVSEQKGARSEQEVVAEASEDAGVAAVQLLAQAAEELNPQQVEDPCKAADSGERLEQAAESNLRQMLGDALRDAESWKVRHEQLEQAHRELQRQYAEALSMAAGLEAARLKDVEGRQEALSSAEAWKGYQGGPLRTGRHGSWRARLSPTWLIVCLLLALGIGGGFYYVQHEALKDQLQYISAKYTAARRQRRECARQKGCCPRVAMLEAGVARLETLLDARDAELKDKERELSAVVPAMDRKIQELQAELARSNETIADTVENARLEERARVLDEVAWRC